MYKNWRFKQTDHEKVSNASSEERKVTTNAVFIKESLFEPRLIKIYALSILIGSIIGTSVAHSTK